MATPAGSYVVVRKRGFTRDGKVIGPCGKKGPRTRWVLESLPAARPGYLATWLSFFLFWSLLARLLWTISDAQ